MHLRVVLAFAVAAVIASAQPRAGALPPDHPGGKAPRVHALTHAHLVPEPGQEIADGTVVIRDGIIAAIGAAGEVRVPPDARVWDLGGRWVYAGLIEPHLWIEAESTDHPGEAQTTPPPTNGSQSPPGAGHRSSRVHPELNMVTALTLPPELRTELRGAGFTAALAVPTRGIFRGASALVNLGEGTPNEEIVRADVAAHLAFEHGGEDNNDYPGSLMGAIALIRQTLLDAEHYTVAMADHERKPAEPGAPGDEPRSRESRSRSRGHPARGHRDRGCGHGPARHPSRP